MTYAFFALRVHRNPVTDPYMAVALTGIFYSDVHKLENGVILWHARRTVLDFQGCLFS